MPNYKVIDGALRLQAREGASGTAARGRRVALVAARFNADIVDAMVVGAQAAWLRQGGDPDSLLLVRVPGAFELPLAARKLAASGRFDAVIALGCVIRGDTAHFDFVAGEAARGIADAARDTGVPVIFGVLTTENVEQAVERASPARMDKGGEAMEAALEMALVLTAIDSP
ncbi:MAG: 6,7-dimethyl-8-ribityllumazine synthase [Gammaproteobacteria bacterium]|jgi:6,7-dimethyl-8-ribityllumazine synthase|nr:6,7-dimethyl-8-ribityllumazine synthase [Gammaproteobacteria bacterium]